MSATLAPDELRAIESRADVDSLGDLQQRRRDLLVRLNPLKAVHGHNGIWDDKRKQLLEACKIRARMQLLATSAKFTETMIEAMGYADEQYASFIDQGITDRIEYLTLANELTEIEERIRSREVELICYNGELKLSR